MKNSILKIFSVMLLLIALNSSVFSQTRDSNTVGKDETVAFLINQNKAANDIIEKQNARIADLESQITVEQENSASIGKSYESAKTEISSLKSSNEALTRAVTLNENTVALLQQDNAKQRDKAKQANKAKWKAYGVAAVAVAIKFLIP